MKFFLVIIILIQSYFVFSQCSDLTVNSTTYSASGLTTCGFGDDFSSSDVCGSSYMGGDDYVIVYTPTTTGAIDVALTNTDTWTGVFISDLCPSNAAAVCLSSNTNSSGNPSITSFNVTAGTTYFITVSTWPSPQCTAFDIDITSGTPPPAAPANDDCSGAYPVTVGAFNGGCVNLTSGTVEAATASSQDASACSGTEDDDVWFSFVAPASGTVNIDLLNISGSVTDMYHSVWSGTCPSLSLVSGSCSDPNSSNLTGLTPGQTYFVRTYTYTSTGGQNTTFDICVEDGACPTLPSNDECSGPISVTVGSFNGGCVSTVSSTIACATQSSQSTTACSGTEDDDVWFSFVAPASGNVNIDLLNISGSVTDMYHSVWSGTCPSLTLVSGSCSDPNSSNLTGLTPGQTYFVRVYTYTSTGGQNTTFDVCIEDGACPILPSNDDCSGAISITPSAQGVTCTPISSTIACATASSQDATACSGTENDDVWFSFVATQTSHNIDITNVVGSTTDLYHSVWTGTCPTLTNVSCSDPNSSGLIGLTVGQTYYIRVNSWSSSAGATTTFDICVTSPAPPPPCNGALPSPNDACASATTINTFDGYCGTTLSTYTVDSNPAFCGSIDNNSWLQFTASETSVNITWWITGGTSCSSGVQFEAYSGSCGSLTAISGSCVNPTGTIGSSGTFSFSGLTIGNTYYIMIDGYAGNVCNYVWQAQSGILPIELSQMEVVAENSYNIIKWTTLSEINNDYFVLEKSYDGINFFQVTKINGSGNSSNPIDYSVNDYKLNEYLTYYKLWQVDFNDEKSLIGVKFINRDSKNNDIAIYPNPAKDQLNFKFDKIDKQQYSIEYIDVTGRVVEETLMLNNSNVVKSKIFESLNKGYYIVRITDQNGNVVKTSKLIKN